MVEVKIKDIVITSDENGSLVLKNNGNNKQGKFAKTVEGCYKDKLELVEGMILTLEFAKVSQLDYNKYREKMMVVEEGAHDRYTHEVVYKEIYNKIKDILGKIRIEDFYMDLMEYRDYIMS